MSGEERIPPTEVEREIYNKLQLASQSLARNRQRLKDWKAKMDEVDSSVESPVESLEHAASVCMRAGMSGSHTSISGAGGTPLHFRVACALPHIPSQNQAESNEDIYAPLAPGQVRIIDLGPGVLQTARASLLAGLSEVAPQSNGNHTRRNKPLTPRSPKVRPNTPPWN